MLSNSNQISDQYLNKKFNPFEVLGIKKEDDPRTGFYNIIIDKDIKKRIMATLAFDSLSTKDPRRYQKHQEGFFSLQKYGLYEAALVSDLAYLKNNLKDFMTKMSVNEHGRSLLYTCCRSGYYYCVAFLLGIGCDVTALQQNQSTPLHVASYYGHEPIVKILISYGASNHQKNQYQHVPSDEARTKEIGKLIKTCGDDKILNLFINLQESGHASCMERLEDDQIIRIYRKGPKGNTLLSDYIKNNNYTRSFHGTNFKFLSPILKTGLKPSGSGGVETKAGHITSTNVFNGILNWGKAIFVTPSPFYAAHAAYAERIKSKNKTYCCMVEAIVQNGSYTSHSSTTVGHQAASGEPSKVEFRIEQEKDSDIMRIEGEQNVIPFSILFLELKMLDGYKEKDIENPYKQIIDNLNAYVLV